MDPQPFSEAASQGLIDEHRRHTSGQDASLLDSSHLAPMTSIHSRLSQFSAPNEATTGSSGPTDYPLNQEADSTNVLPVTGREGSGTHLVSMDSTGFPNQSNYQQIINIDMADTELDVNGNGRNLYFPDISWYVHFMQWTMLICFLFLGSLMLYIYSSTWSRKCDLMLKIWTLVWVSRLIILLAMNITATRLRMRRNNIHVWFLLIMRILHVGGFIWLVFGMHVIFYTPNCQAETSSMVAAKVMFWSTVVMYLLPYLLYAMLLLCLPLAVYFVVRLNIRSADRQPTPPEIVAQLEVKKYRDLVETLREQYNIESYDGTLRSGISSLSITNDIMNTLLGAPPTQTTVSPAGPVSASASSGRPSRPPDFEQLESGALATISINKACPICMMDMDDGDEVTVMPCDNRHFFHKTCVEQWLEGNQVCPICRANIVTLLTPNEGGASSSSETMSAV